MTARRARSSYSAVLIATMLATSLLASSARAGGPIILAGHDPDDHGFTAQYTPLFNAIYANVTNSGSGILAIGADPATSAGNWITTVAGLMTPPQTVTFVNNAAISSVSFSGFAIIHVPSTNVDTPGGINATTENPLLTARATDIAAFINGGGGLFGLTQDQVADAYDYLGVFADVQSTGVPASGDCDGGAGSALYDDVTATPLGTSLGITNTNIDGCCWHNTFSNFAPFLQTLATANEPLCTSPAINGEPSVIGCLQCNVPGQMNLTLAVDLNPPNSMHTVTATFLEASPPNDPIVGVTITFNVVSGPNTGATGNDITDINGQATFTYTGTGGIGLDVIQATGVDPVTLDVVVSNDALKFWDEDCNGNSIPDTCDLDCSAYAGACLANYPMCGGSVDANSNDVPDECDDCVDDGDCDDGIFCNGAEACVLAACQPGTPVDCDDGVTCTIDACNEATDDCDNTPSNALCDNGLFCDGAEICNPTLGCQDGSDPNCNDGVTCTVDACNEATDDCDNTPSNALCDNGLFCDGAEICNPTLGCQDSSDPNCNDGVTCTVDACNEATDDCDNTPNDAICNDGLFCNGAETCDPINDCEVVSPLDCDDGFACSVDSCDEVNDACVNDAGLCICGDALPGPGEECDPPSPPTSELCADSIDNDGDNLIDCEDPDCPAFCEHDPQIPCIKHKDCRILMPGIPPVTSCLGAATCDTNCQQLFACNAMGPDPSKIRFDKTSTGLDYFTMHASFVPQTDMDPVADGFSVLLTNANGVVYRAELFAGDLVQKGSRFMFKDVAAKQGTGSRDGLYKISLRRRMIYGKADYSFKIRAFGDFSAATLALMRTQVKIGNDGAQVFEEWTQNSNGWELFQKDF